MEHVWVVRRRDLFPRATPHGFVRMSERDMREGWLETMLEKGFFVERREAERSPEWKQVIPYCLVRSGGDWLLLERLAAQSEARLHGRLSLGVGGHINPCDADLDEDLITAGAWRELREEIGVNNPGQAGALQPLGLLNDDSNEVGAVHVGLVFGLQASEPAPRIREQDKMRGSWTPLAELQSLCKDPGNFETWTAEILRVPGWQDW